MLGHVAATVYDEAAAGAINLFAATGLASCEHLAVYGEILCRGAVPP